MQVVNCQCGRKEEMPGLTWMRTRPSMGLWTSRVVGKNARVDLDAHTPLDGVVDKQNYW